VVQRGGSTASGPTGPSDPAGAPEILVYLEALSTADNKMYGFQDQVNGILNTLVTNANSLGEPWGNDSYGKQFASGPNGYIASRHALLEGSVRCSAGDGVVAGVLR
jgi:hypothetical protein